MRTSRVRMVVFACAVAVTLCSVSAAHAQEQECNGYLNPVWAAPADLGRGDGSSPGNAMDLPTAKSMWRGGGNTICLVPGVYALPTSRSTTQPTWSVSVSGAAGAQNVIVCRVNPLSLPEPVSTNPNRCEFRATGNTYGSPLGGATIGANDGVSYLTISGIYCNGAAEPLAVDGGCVSLRAGAGKIVENVVIDDQCNVGTCDDSNFAAIFVQQCVDCVIRNSRIRGGTNQPLNHNKTGITLYNARNFLITRMTFEGVNTGIFVKGGNGGSDPMSSFNDGVISYSSFKDCTNTAADFGDTNNQGVVFERNLVVRCVGVELGSGGAPTHHITARWNTIVDSYSAGGWSGCFGMSSPRMITNVTWTDNICFYSMRAAFPAVDLSGRSVSETMTAIDRNCYYRGGGGAGFQQAGNDHTSLGAWQRSAGSPDSESVTGNPGFVNPGAGNYRLRGGGPCATVGAGGVPPGAYSTGSEQIGAGV